jgi:hypothetical protein
MLRDYSDRVATSSSRSTFARIADCTSYLNAFGHFLDLPEAVGVEGSQFAQAGKLDVQIVQRDVVLPRAFQIRSEGLSRFRRAAARSTRERYAGGVTP